MSKKIYVCNECGFVFPVELTELIEKRIQVYCEKCGSPFSLEGIVFKESRYQPGLRIKTRSNISKKKMSFLKESIEFLNEWSYIPILIISIVSLCLLLEIIINPTSWVIILSSRLLFGLSGLLIALYDLLYISPKIKEKKYNEVVLDSFCWGIIGCIFFGTGVVILIKGIFVLFYVLFDSYNKKLKSYDFGLLLKDSLNNFSGIAGFLIILLSFYGISIGIIDVRGKNVYIVFFIMAIISLLVDLKIKNTLKKQQRFDFLDFSRTLAIGILATLYSAAGIFIILKGALLFFMMFGEPSPIIKKTPEKKLLDEKDKKEIPPKERVETELESIPIITSRKPLDEPIETKIKIKEDITPKELKKEIKLKIHESLLPIKDEKDKKLVKEYFIKIFTILSKDLRNQILELKIPKNDKKELLRELAFLTAEEQIKYVDNIINLYKEIPKKLIERIKRLPNVKPEYYDKIIEQLKYMDAEEQVRFIVFLEQNV